MLRLLTKAAKLWLADPRRLSRLDRKARRLRVLIVTSQDSGGGAPRAIHRIYEALRDHCSSKADVYLRVVHKSYYDDHIIGGKPKRSHVQQIEYLMRTRFRKYFPRKPFFSENRLLHSEALYDSGLAHEINGLKPDVIMLGWLGNSTLSIREIGKIEAPVVWRLSDMWMFAGAEHYTEYERSSSAYSRASRPATEEGPDINRRTFLRKRRYWRSPQHVICPSRWIAEKVQSSKLSESWPTHVIPNPIDTQTWRPASRSEARKALGLQRSARIVLFGAGSGLKDKHKGGDLFIEALRTVSDLAEQAGQHENEIVAALFGEAGKSLQVGHIRAVRLGRLDDSALRHAYSAADVMVVPSRIDNLPSTAVEAQACGCPVVAFPAGGLVDIVEDGVTGRLAKALGPTELGLSIWKVIEEPALAREMGRAARNRAKTEWSPARIGHDYLAVLLRAAEGTERE